MAVGIAILAHSNLYRVAELCRHFSAAGCRVAVHIDSLTNDAEFKKFKDDIAEDPSVIVTERTRCEWGTFALHSAGLSCAQALIEAFEDVSHIVLVSGSCLPIRPVAELVEFLEAAPEADFVESRRLGQDRWVQEGLEEERFSLFHIFSWRKHRWLFDKAVELQRRLGIRRKAPKDLELSIGSQWWALSRKTLTKILTDPRKAEWDAFFKHCWIVDESYVQTLVRRHSVDLREISLTLTEFDPQGKPFTFYDDHAGILEASDKFIARKIWHGSNALYSKYLYGAESLAAARRAETLDLPAIIEAGRERRCQGRPGLLSIGRFPCRGFEAQPSTVRPYLVLDGYEHVFSGLDRWLKVTGVDLPHGRLFDKESIQIHPDAALFGGGATNNPAVRDWNPEQFLVSLLWQGREKTQSFYYNPGDNIRISKFILQDPNAMIFSISGAWMMSLAPSIGETDEEFRRRALRLQSIEAQFDRLISAKTTRAEVFRISLEDVLAEPGKALSALVTEGMSQNAIHLLNHVGAPVFQDNIQHGLRRLTACGFDLEGVQTAQMKDAQAVKVS